MPKFTIQEELDKDVLVEIPIDKKFEPIHAVYAYRKDKWLSPPLKLFFQLLEQYKGWKIDNLIFVKEREPWFKIIESRL